MPDQKKLIRLLNDLYGVKPWPKPLHLLRGVMLVEEGHSRKDAARMVGTTEVNLARVLASKDRIKTIVGERQTPPTVAELERRRVVLGQLPLGRAAEIVFEEIYKKDVGTTEFRLVDQRGSRSDTDYRMLNGSGRPVWRINIKFHGSPFRKAAEYVGLETEDCFPLATYKIHQALQKQEAEHLAYIFLIVNVPDLTAKSIGDQLPEKDISTLLQLLVSPMSGKRDIEDRFPMRWRTDGILPSHGPLIEYVTPSGMCCRHAARTNCCGRSCSIGSTPCAFQVSLACSAKLNSTCTSPSKRTSAIFMDS